MPRACSAAARPCRTRRGARAGRAPVRRPAQPLRTHGSRRRRDATGPRSAVSAARCPSAGRSRTRASSCWTPAMSPVAGGGRGRAVHRRRAGGPRLPGPSGADGGELRPGRLLGGARRPPVPHGRPRAVDGGRRGRVPGPRRLPGEGARLPHRAGRDRGRPAAAPGRARVRRPRLRGDGARGATWSAAPVPRRAARATWRSACRSTWCRPPSWRWRRCP